MIYSAYYFYISNRTTGFQVIGYSKCRSENETTRLEMNGLVYPLRNDAVQMGCPGHIGCEIGSFRLYAEIPVHVPLPDKVKLITERSSVQIPVKKAALVQRTTQRDMDPNRNLHRLGQGSDHLDCLMRCGTKFAAIVDFDDFITTREGTILDYIQAQERNDATIGSLYFIITIVAHLQQPLGDDWLNYDFSYLETAEICDHCKHDEYKPIMMPDKVDLPFTHFVKQFRNITDNTTYKDIVVPKDQGVSHHGRYEYVNPVDYDERFTNQTFLPKQSVDKLRVNYKRILNRLMALHKNLTIADTISYMNKCSRYIAWTCQIPLHSCINMEELEDWVKFSGTGGKGSSNYIMLW
ncbi:hypothetical protein QR680_016023 [Steinernema hermaphroditum]|uniref:Glycosyltransferase family 92 protein n=1 Tax=Steinernema hermaphroditum TaxID=289476 RepID=A0AA39HBP5_9BILA|nr:hypothetical protein QR680_016023 [Steinernema hermaphroditum]